MSDLISRQAAIDAVEEYADRLQMVDWKENPGVSYKVHALNWCINTIRDLPSAQPVFSELCSTELTCEGCKFEGAIGEFCDDCCRRYGDMYEERKDNGRFNQQTSGD